MKCITFVVSAQLSYMRGGHLSEPNDSDEAAPVLLKKFKSIRIASIFNAKNKQR